MLCKSILIVEDDEAIRYAVAEVLRAEGYPVYTATNGKEAIQWLSTVGHPCLILLDLMMPVMNGWEFLAAKKADDVVAAIPVVVMSAAGDTAAKVAQSDANEFIRKPIDLDVLMKAVHRYCGEISPKAS